MSQPPGQPGQPYGGAPGGMPGQPPKKSNTLKILMIVGGVLLLLTLLCCGSCVGLGFWATGEMANQVQNSYASDPSVVEELGSDVEFTYNMVASAEESQNNPGGPKRMVFDVKGSEGSGQIIVKQQPSGSKPFSGGVLRTSDGREIPLD